MRAFSWASRAAHFPVITFEQLEERIVLDGAVDDVSSRADSFIAQVTDAGAEGVAESDPSLADIAGNDVPSLEAESGTEWLQDGTWHYWQQDWGADGNGYEFHAWQDGTTWFHQVQWESAPNSKGTHNGFEYWSLDCFGSWAYWSVQWDANQNGHSYIATRVEGCTTYAYETHQWSNGMGYSYISDSSGQWTHHICQAGNESGDVLEYTSDSTGHYDFTYRWANGHTWQDTNNHLPVARDFSEYGDEDTTIIVDGWAMNGADQEDTLASVTVTDLPAHGTLRLNDLSITLDQVISAADLSKVSFVPDANWNGMTAFTYEVTDSQGAVSNTSATATISVAEVDDAPTMARLRMADPTISDNQGMTSTYTPEGGTGYTFYRDQDLNRHLGTVDIAIGSVSPLRPNPMVIAVDFWGSVIWHYHQRGDYHGFTDYTILSSPKYYEEVSKSWSPMHNTSVAMGDIDGDGLINNMVVGTQKGSLVYVGGTWRSLGTDYDFTTCVELGDVNGDGWLDVVAGNYKQTNKVYLGDGKGGFSTGTAIGTDAGKTKSVALGDVNGDGRLDVVAGNSEQTNKAYLGDGKGGFSAGTAIGTDADKTESVALGDLNLDGWLDVVAGNFGQTNKVYLGDGKGGFSTGTAIGTDADATTSVALGDLNLDGRLDLVVGNMGTWDYVYLNRPY